MPPIRSACSSPTRPANFNRPIFVIVGLHRTAAHILGVDLEERPPRLALPDDSRPIAEPYAVIAVQATSGAKYWNNPNGWREVVAFLKARGYRVICIDQKAVHGHGIMWTISRTASRMKRASRWSRRPAGSRTPRSSSACRAASPGSPGRPDARWW